MCSLAVQNFDDGHLALARTRLPFPDRCRADRLRHDRAQRRVTLQGEPVQLRADGSFTVRFSLPDSRQIIPAVAASADGIEERTIVLAVERNTKELEPMIHDNSEI